MSETGAGTRGRPEQRDRFIAGATQYAVEHGIADLSLRPLAAELGTSDRMLLYYFGSRDELIREILRCLGDGLRFVLTEQMSPEPLAPAALLDRIWGVVSDPELANSLLVYIEVDARAVRDIAPFTTAASEAGALWMGWLREHLDVPEAEKATVAAALLAIVDGLLLQLALPATAPTDDAMAWIRDRLAGPQRG